MQNPIIITRINLAAQNNRRDSICKSQIYTTNPAGFVSNGRFKTKSPLSLLVVALTLLSPSSSAASDSTYNTFVQCMQKKTNDNKISGVIYAQTNPSYTSVLRAYIRNARFNTTTTKKPALIFTPKSETQVPPAIFCANATGLRLKTRSGGHDYAGVSYVDSVPFLIVDMFALSSVSVDLKTSTAWVGAGATLGEVYYGIWKLSKSLGFPAGVCPTVGVGGHISGGGYGNMIRKYGLAVDHVLDARIVDVNGNILDRKSMGEDLFWAIRGGGGASFGVILAYKIGLVPVPSTVTVFEAERILDQDKDMTDFVHQWQTAAPTTNDGLFMRMLIQPITSKVNKKQKTVRSTVVAFFLGKADELVSTLAKDFPLLRLKKENVTEMTWVQSILWWANIDEKSPETVLLDRKLDAAIFGYRKSDYVQKPISKEGLAALWKKVVEQGKVGLVFNPYGGRMNQVPEGASPFPHRAGNLFKMQYSISWREPGAAAEANATTQIRNLYSFMTPFVSKNPRSSFLNYRDLDIGVNSFGPNSYKEGRVYGLKYFGAKNFDRLVKIKTAVDPQNFFKSEQSIPTLPQKA